MVAGAILAIGLSVSSPMTAALSVSHDVKVHGRQVVLGELADASQLPATIRFDAANIPVATFKPGQTQMRLAMADLKGRVRARAPMIARMIRDQDDAIIDIRLDEGTTSSLDGARNMALKSTACARVEHLLAKDSIPTANDFSPSACAGTKPSVALRYDPANGVVRPIRALRVGDIIPAPPAFSVPSVRPGQRLYVKTRVGPVVVEREVEALQPGHSGESLFVKAGDQGVFPVALAEAKP